MDFRNHPVKSVFKAIYGLIIFAISKMTFSYAGLRGIVAVLLGIALALFCIYFPKKLIGLFITLVILGVACIASNAASSAEAAESLQIAVGTVIVFIVLAVLFLKSFGGSSRGGSADDGGTAGGNGTNKVEWTRCPSCGSKSVSYKPGLSAVIRISDPCWYCYGCGLYEYLYSDGSSHYKGRYGADGEFYRFDER